MNISKMIRENMDEQGIKAAEIAKRTGYTSQYIHNLLEGNRRWNETTLSKTCDALGLQVKLVPLKTGADVK